MMPKPPDRLSQLLAGVAETLDIPDIAPVLEDRVHVGFEGRNYAAVRSARRSQKSS